MAGGAAVMVCVGWDSGVAVRVLVPVCWRGGYGEAIIRGVRLFYIDVWLDV